MPKDPDSKPPARKHAGSDATAPYPVSRMAPAFGLVDLAREVEEADNMLANVAHGKLRIIAEQMRTLREEAERVLEQARRDQELHRARCNFKRQPGRIYHLYRRGNGELYFSMLSPREWGGAPPHPFEGSFRLENDMSWTPAEAGSDPDRETDALVRQLLGDGKAP